MQANQRIHPTRRANHIAMSPTDKPAECSANHTSVKDDEHAQAALMTLERPTENNEHDGIREHMNHTDVRPLVREPPPDFGAVVLTIGPGPAQVSAAPADAVQAREPRVGACRGVVLGLLQREDAPQEAHEETLYDHEPWEPLLSRYDSHLSSGSTGLAGLSRLSSLTLVSRSPRLNGIVAQGPNAALSDLRLRPVLRLLRLGSGLAGCCDWSRHDHSL
mmetsp:Transcript_139291/g.347243  ORF Transcript_139291/g.347243 Transcript_139291/m.347243 type:complete len:219 (+) Transcript_139291:601-1257(+)